MGTEHVDANRCETALRANAIDGAREIACAIGKGSVEIEQDDGNR